MGKEGLGLEITELRLGLPGGGGGGGTSLMEIKNERKRVFSEMGGDDEEDNAVGDRKLREATKNQVVVGWPPVCSYRRKNSFNEKEKSESEVSKMYVKVSMDGAPFLRKLDIGIHKGYSDLALALENLFGCFAIGKALKDAESSEYIPIYEDKDGDWMLVGDVPWEMFLETCKRLRIMKRSEAKGFGLNSSKRILKGSIKHENA